MLFPHLHDVVCVCRSRHYSHVDLIFYFYWLCDVFPLHWIQAGGPNRLPKRTPRHPRRPETILREKETGWAAKSNLTLYVNNCNAPGEQSIDWLESYENHRRDRAIWCMVSYHTNLLTCMVLTIPKYHNAYLKTHFFASQFEALSYGTMEQSVLQRFHT